MQYFRIILTLFGLLTFMNSLGAEEGPNFTFNAISDIPYSKAQNSLLEDTIIPALTVSESPFLIHMGDIKGGGIACTDALMAKRYAQIMKMHPQFVFFTPGDNDWTDCDRKNTGSPVSELESLDKLRRLFYSQNITYPERWQVAQQHLYPENKRWLYENVAFATVHLVGTNNGRMQIKKDNVEFALSQVSARDEANKYWINTLFNIAQEEDSSAIIIAVQADVSKVKFSNPCTDKEPSNCDGFLQFKAQIKIAAANYGKPVLLLHGDTSPYCMDKQFGGEEAPNLWRFNSAGDYEVLDAVKITVYPDDSSTPFKMESLREELSPKEHC